jgi:AraC-like DNA-binding protein
LKFFYYNEAAGESFSMPSQAILLETPRLMAVTPIQEFIDKSEAFRTNIHTELLLIQAGRGEIHCENQVFTVKANDLVIFHPEVAHAERSSSDSPLKGLSIVVGNLLVQDLPPGYLVTTAAPPILQLNKNYETLNRFFMEIYSESRENKLGSDDLIVFLLQSILIHIIRISIQPKETVHISTLAQKVREYIKENFTQDLSLNDLAAFVYVNPYHLAHIFKENIGMSPIQYMIKCRIDEAKRLLEHSDMSVREIGLQVGYPNANYFNILFKKMTGESPGKYRKT